MTKGCSGKVRHETQPAAEEQLADMRDRDVAHRQSRTLGVYACRLCQGFHIGHDRYKVPPRRRGRYRARRPA